MKNSVVALCLAIFCTWGSAAEPALSITAPHGGEVFIAGTTQQVSLGARTRVNLVLVELTVDGGTTFTSLGTITLAKFTTPTLSFVVPNTPGTNCFIRVSGLLGSRKLSVNSAPFSVFPATVISSNNTVTANSIAPGAVVTGALADGSVTNPKLAALAVTSDKISSGQSSSNFVLTADGSGNANWQAQPAALPPTGPAGGALSGTYPNPTLVLPIAGTTPATRGVVYADNSSILVAPDGKLTATNPIGNPTSGDLTGTYPNPTIAATAGNHIVAALNNPATTTSINSVALLAGRAGGQTLNGGTNASQNLVLDSTANSLKGSVQIAPNGGLVGIGTGAAVPNATLQIKASSPQSVPALLIQNASGAVSFAVEAQPGGGANNTMAGVNAGVAVNGGSSNSFFGSTAGMSTTTGDVNTFIGAAAGQNNTTGSFNTFVGGSAGQSHTTGSQNTFIGADAGFHNAASNNTFTGSVTGANNTSGANNSFYGVNAGTTNTAGSNNSYFGFGAGQASTGDDNTFVGMNAGLGTTGGRNTIVGKEAGTSTTSDQNCFFGVMSGFVNTSGGANSFFGMQSGYSNTTGFSNTFLGGFSGESTNSGAQNTFVGTNSGLNNTTGTNNNFHGMNSGLNNTTGSNNIAIGYGAGSNLTTGDNNIDIFDSGAAAEANTIRIGTKGTQTATFIAGIRGTTTGVNNAVPVVIDSNGQLGTVSSSRRYKEDIHNMGSISDRLLKLRPVTFRYTKAYANGEKPIQYGLIAEEVAEVFPDLAVYNADGQPETVRYQDLAPLLLNEFQKEHAKVEALEARLAALEKLVAKTVDHPEK